MDIPRAELEKIITQAVLKHLKDKGEVSDCSCEIQSPSVAVPKPNGQNIAVIMFGGLGGISGVCQILKSQQRKNRHIACFQTPFSLEVNGNDFLERELPGVEPAPELGIMSSIEWLKQFQLVVLGSLERTSAAKLALGITDNLETKMVYSALGLGLPIVGNTESFHKADCALCAGENPVVEKMAKDYEDTLRKMGITFSPVEELNKVIENFWEGPQAESSLPTLKGVVTTEDVANWSKSEFWVGEGTILTPSAKDLLREKNVEILEK